MLCAREPYTAGIRTFTDEKTEFLIGKSLAQGHKPGSGMEGFGKPQSIWLQRLGHLYTAPSWPLDRVMVRTGSGFCTRPTVLPRNTHLSTLSVWLLAPTWYKVICLGGLKHVEA